MLILVVVFIFFSCDSNKSVGDVEELYSFSDLILTDSLRINESVVLNFYQDEEIHNKYYFQYSVGDSLYPLLSSSNAFSGFFNSNIETLRKNKGTWFIVNSNVVEELVGQNFLFNAKEDSNNQEMLTRILSKYVQVLFTQAEVTTDSLDINVIDNSYQISISSGVFLHKFLIHDELNQTFEAENDSFDVIYLIKSIE